MRNDTRPVVRRNVAEVASRWHHPQRCPLPFQAQLRTLAFMHQSTRAHVKTRLTRPALALLCIAAWFSQGAAAADHPFDGRWSVVLVCPDTTDKSGLVKGYEYTFAILIHDGAVHGEYGAPGHPASVVYDGTVGDDGTLEIAATGNTNRSEYSVGKVPQGTRYGYTMQGKLAGSAGQATRRELRPCTATFGRSPRS